MLASLSPQDRGAAIRVLERESLSQTQEISSSGKKKLITEEPFQKDSRREVSTLSPAVQELTVKHLVSLIKRKQPAVSQNNAAPRGTNSRRGTTKGANHDDAKPT
jgi:hypothetical protein